MKKRDFLSLISLLLALVFLVGCSPAYKDDARMGSYIALAADGTTVAYRLTLEENGEGVITYYPVIGAEESEEIIFTIDEGSVLVLHGTEITGGVVGRNEYHGNFVLEGDAYSFELRAVATSVPLALFTAEK